MATPMPEKPKPGLREDITGIVQELIKPSVTSTITWAAFGVLAAMLLTGKVIPPWYTDTVQLLLGYWFGSSVANGHH